VPPEEEGAERLFLLPRATELTIAMRRTPSLSRRQLLAAPALLAHGAAPAVLAQGAARPSPRQLLWHQLETYAFLHFSINTFTDKEWGYGDEDPALFAPTSFDADAIVDALVAGGMKAVILTCKHHDGFCLWPTATTSHSVKSTPFGRDVVKEISQAAAARDLKFGVYLSPWDRNHAAYGRPEYVDVYRRQLTELLTNYGPVFEVWHDGANGGDGFYGGAREKRLIDKRSYYGWPETWELVRKLQPDAVIFSDVGPDVRWVGNEKGFANETCWATYSPVGPDGGPPAPGYTRDKEGMTGHRDSPLWLPAECDVSIRPGWFFHEKENDRVKTGADLMDLYLRSVGRGASFLLNIPPDRRGRLHDRDVASLFEFGRLLRGTFAENLAGLLHRDNAVDVSGDWNIVRLREDIAHGQQVDAFVVDALQEDRQWKPIAEGTSIGACRIIRFPELQTSRKIRIRILTSSGKVVWKEAGVYRETL
jgi:alpha-L-fucosidase